MFTIESLIHILCSKDEFKYISMFIGLKQYIKIFKQLYALQIYEFGKASKRG